MDVREGIAPETVWESRQKCMVVTSIKYFSPTGFVWALHPISDKLEVGFIASFLNICYGSLIRTITALSPQSRARLIRA